MSARRDRPSIAAASVASTTRRRRGPAPSDALALDALRQRANASETLYRAALAVSGTLDTDETIDRILHELAWVIPYDSASVQLLDGHETVIIGCAGFRSPDQIMGHRFDLAHTPANRYCIEHGEPLLINDTSIQPLLDYPNAERWNSWLGLPLRVRGRVIGMLTIDSTVRGYFTENMVRIGGAFASQVAIALENARLHSNEVKARERLTALHRAVREISVHITSPAQIYEAIYRAVERVMTADGFAISVLHPERGEVESVYIVDRGRHYPAVVTPIAGSLTEHIIATGQSLRLVDSRSYAGHPIEACGHSEPPRSVLAAVVRGSALPIGILFVQSYTSAIYTEADQELLELLAAHAGAVLENAQRYAETERLAITDALTQLPNRRRFFDLARQELERAERYGHAVSVALLDVDHFKQINDRYGHIAGDHVLHAVAARCNDNLRVNDLIGRYGGEEIVMLLPETDAAGALLLSDRLREAIADPPVATELFSIAVTVSLGVATATPQERTSIEALIGAADEALYAAKRAGRNRVRVADTAAPHGHS